MALYKYLLVKQVKYYTTPASKIAEARVPGTLLCVEKKSGAREPNLTESAIHVHMVHWRTTAAAGRVHVDDHTHFNPQYIYI